MRLKTILKCAAGIVLLALAVTAAIAWTAAGQLLHPDRQRLRDDQKKWLTHPAAHGLRIHAQSCDHGRVPCLMVAPDASKKPGKRGAALRRQLANHGDALSPYGETYGILVLLHGRNGRKESLLPVAERFAAAGFKCVIPDLPAHGDSPVKNVHFAANRFERDLPDHVLADARAFFGEPTTPAGIWGISMGGAFAVEAVARSPGTWKAMVIIASFDSLQGVVDDTLAPLPKPLPGMLGMALDGMTQYRGDLALHKVRPDLKAENIVVPIFIAHGDRDPLISPARGHQLYDAFSSEDKTWTPVPGANHGNILVTKIPLYARMSAWLLARVK